MPSAETLDTMDAYWAEFLGCPRGALRPGEPTVVVHGPSLADYAGVYLQSFGAAPVVSVPPSLADRLTTALAEAARGGLDADERWGGVFGPELAAMVGPAWIGYADAGTIRAPEAGDGVRLLDHEDGAVLAALRRAVTPVEWEHGGSDPADGPLVGAFDGEALAAVAGYQVWGGRIAHLAVVTHPAARGRGHGRRVVGRAAVVALERGLVLQYRALEDNTASLGIARGLGFVPYATSLALRLRP